LIRIYRLLFKIDQFTCYFKLLDYSRSIEVGNGNQAVQSGKRVMKIHQNSVNG